MLNYLKIFSKLLVLFGCAGLAALAFGLTPRLGSIGLILIILMMQLITGGMILYGFKLQELNKISIKSLQVFGWIMVLLLIVMSQVMINIGGIKI